ncbi:parathyroid hormone-like hormone b [Misgurnus anguillicaudatus]|uniref:parathyroid hormone-like hormone b n=1 Tax=Misgurnus anguillicaudatus TaxID=75329 RepID=UPI002434F248|nr:parathyroid hormone-like hormone b [Misgurnus anguillicaudatus]
MLRHWGLAMILLVVPIPVEPRPTNTLSRQRRSVSHAQMMHDRSRYLQDRKRRLLINELLGHVHTAQMWDSPNHSDGNFQSARWPIAHRSKYPISAKNYPLSFQHMRTRDSLPQETSKTLRYGESKRKRKICSERWRDPDRRRDWGCQSA